MIVADNYNSQSTENQDIQEKIQRSLRYSIIDGVFYSIKVGIGASFFSAFAIFLNANNIQLGLIGTLPQVLGSIVQLYAHNVLNWFKSRKTFVCTGAFLQGAMLIPIMLAFFLGTWKVYYLIAFISFYFIFGMILGPAWASWMGDLVSQETRGTYFGKRSRLLEIASFSSMLLGGYILHSYSNGTDRQYWGFAIIFSLAFMARVISFIFLSKKYHPEYKPLPESELKFSQFLRHLPCTSYGTFVIFMCTMHIAVFSAAPFFAPYILIDLQFDYMTFTIVNALVILTKFVFLARWGRLCDQFGTKKILVLTGFAMPVVPLLWLLGDKIWYIILVQIYSGIVWAGFEIASFNFMFDMTDREHRLTYISYYNVINGIGMFLGGIVGGLLVRYNHVFDSKYLLVFLVSGILRYVIAIVYLPKFQEARVVEAISYGRLCLALITMPTMRMIHKVGKC